MKYHKEVESTSNRDKTSIEENSIKYFFENPTLNKVQNVHSG